MLEIYKYISNNLRKKNILYDNSIIAIYKIMPASAVVIPLERIIVFS